MGGNVAVHDLVKSMVSISRFNKGEAGKIFDEVNKEGIKVVLKNNSPACVLLSPDVFEEIRETLEDYRLLVEAERRMEKSREEDYVSEADAMRELGISEDDLKKADTGS